MLLAQRACRLLHCPRRRPCRAPRNRPPWPLRGRGRARVHLEAAAAARFSKVQVSFDVTYARWREQPPPAAVFTLDLDIGQLTDLVRLPKSKDYPPVGFRDLLIPALGIEWRALDGLGPLSIDARAGYRYEGSPIPEQDGDSSFGDSDKHILSIGLGAELAGISKILPRPIAFDGYFGLTYLPLRVFRKADPRSAVGDFTVAGFVLQGGVQTRLSF